MREFLVPELSDDSSRDSLDSKHYRPKPLQEQRAIPFLNQPIQTLVSAERRSIDLEFEWEPSPFQFIVETPIDELKKCPERIHSLHLSVVGPLVKSTTVFPTSFEQRHISVTSTPITPMTTPDTMTPRRTTLAPIKLVPVRTTSLFRHKDKESDVKRKDSVHSKKSDQSATSTKAIEPEKVLQFDKNDKPSKKTTFFKSDFVEVEPVNVLKTPDLIQPLCKRSLSYLADANITQGDPAPVQWISIAYSQKPQPWRPSRPLLVTNLNLQDEEEREILPLNLQELLKEQERRLLALSTYTKYGRRLSSIGVKTFRSVSTLVSPTGSIPFDSLIPTITKQPTQDSSSSSPIMTSRMPPSLLHFTNEYHSKKAKSGFKMFGNRKLGNYFVRKPAPSLAPLVTKDLHLFNWSFPSEKSLWEKQLYDPVQVTASFGSSGLCKSEFYNHETSSDSPTVSSLTLKPFSGRRHSDVGLSNASRVSLTLMEALEMDPNGSRTPLSLKEALELGPNGSRTSLTLKEALAYEFDAMSESDTSEYDTLSPLSPLSPRRCTLSSMDPIHCPENDYFMDMSQETAVALEHVFKPTLLHKKDQMVPKRTTSILGSRLSRKQH